MSSKNYIPRNDTEFYMWAYNMINYATAHCINWRVSEPGDEMNNLLTEFDLALQAWKAANSGKIDLIRKNNARKALEKACRTYVQGFLAKNPYVTDEDRGGMKLTVYDKIPTTVNVPLGQADAEIDYIGRLQLRLRMNHIDNTPIDPKANYGFRIYFGIYAAADTPPATGKELRESKFTRRKSEIFIFQPEDAGKTVYFCIRYENSKGEAGTWGPVFSALIP